MKDTMIFILFFGVIVGCGGLSIGVAVKYWKRHCYYLFGLYSMIALSSVIDLFKLLLRR